MNFFFHCTGKMEKLSHNCLLKLMDLKESRDTPITISKNNFVINFKNVCDVLTIKIR